MHAYTLLRPEATLTLTIGTCMQILNVLLGSGMYLAVRVRDAKMGVICQTDVNLSDLYDISRACSWLQY